MRVHVVSDVHGAADALARQRQRAAKAIAFAGKDRLEAERAPGEPPAPSA